jgi:hypothetical protein
MTLERPAEATERAGSTRGADGQRRSFYDLFGELLLEVRGEGGRSTEQFRRAYRRFAVAAPTRRPDVVVERATETAPVDRTLGGERDHYGWTGDRFVVRSGSEFMAVDPGWRHVRVSPDWEPFYATYPVEFHLRRRLVDRDRALVHASGVERDGTTTLFPAWRGAGKTNTLLSLLRDGGGFLADDRLWVGSDGVARGYPLALNLHPRNARSFPTVDFGHDSAERRLRTLVDERVQQRFGTGRSLAARGLSTLSAQLVRVSTRDFVDVEALLPGVECVDASPVDDVVFLDAAPAATGVTVEPVSVAEALATATAISHHEWDARLAAYFHAHDALVPSGTAVAELERVVAAERRILGEFFEGVETYRATVPRERDWSERGVDRAVVRAVESLREPERSTP